MYRGQDLSFYPICDSDIWVDINIAKIETILFEKYKKIVIADVVYNELLKWGNNKEFSFIATNLKRYIKENKIVIIKHDKIEEEERKLLEKQLLETKLNFISGLSDFPHEKNKGEIVSALYAKHFELLFLKSNDGIFKGENAGRKAFPDLVVKNRMQTLNDLIGDPNKCREINQLIQDNRAFMNEAQRLYKAETEKKEITMEDIEIMLRRMRGGK